MPARARTGAGEYADRVSGCTCPRRRLSCLLHLLLLHLLLHLYCRSCNAECRRLACRRCDSRKCTVPPSRGRQSIAEVGEPKRRVEPISMRGGGAAARRSCLDRDRPVDSCSLAQMSGTPPRHRCSRGRSRSRSRSRRRDRVRIVPAVMNSTRLDPLLQRTRQRGSCVILKSTSNAAAAVANQERSSPSLPLRRGGRER